jgi:hypothetical protein
MASNASLVNSLDPEAPLYVVKEFDGFVDVHNVTGGERRFIDL